MSVMWSTGDFGVTESWRVECDRGLAAHSWGINATARAVEPSISAR
jgi:hypothetical protein